MHAQPPRLRGVERMQRMNWNQIEGNWTQFKGKAREQWGKLTDDDLEQIGGRKDQLVGAIQKRYGVAQEDAERQTDEWSGKVDAA